MGAESDRTTHRIARALGWASVCLGAAQIAVPRAVTRLAGVDDSPPARATVPLLGARELLHGALLLRGRDAAAWTWTRVAGDAMDLTLLGRATARRRGWRRRRALAVTAAITAITAADVYAAVRWARHRQTRAVRVTHLHAAITVDRPCEETYRFWRDFSNLPRFMAHVESVESQDGHQHWRAKGPGRRTVEWDAEVVEDRPGELIAWRSTEPADVRNRGSVRFTDAPGDRGTELRVDLEYEQPAGKVGAVFARLMGEHPEQQVRDDLRRFKQTLETGEPVRSEGSPQGTRAWGQARQRPAQPIG
jgi:uncharacterized membrane protein